MQLIRAENDVECEHGRFETRAATSSSRGIAAYIYRECMKRFISSAIILFSLAYHASASEKTPSEYMRNAAAAQERGDWDEARRIYTRAFTEANLAQADPGFKAVLHYEYGRSLGVTCFFEEAERQLNLANGFDKHTGSVFYLSLSELARLNLDQGKFAKAVSYLERVLAELNPAQATAIGTTISSRGVPTTEDAILQELQADLQAQNINQDRMRKLDHEATVMRLMETIKTHGDIALKRQQEVAKIEGGNIFEQIVGLFTVPELEEEAAAALKVSDIASDTLAKLNQHIQSSAVTTAAAQTRITENTIHGAIEADVPAFYANVLDDYALALSGAGRAQEAEAAAKQAAEIRGTIPKKQSISDRTPYGKHCAKQRL